MTKTFLGIRFWNGSTNQLIESADAVGGLFTVPSAPSLAQMRRDPHLMDAYQASDFAVVDGGYVALVLRVVFRRNLPRISGLQILQRLVGEKPRRSIPFHERHILWVVPTPADKDRIDYYLEDQGFPRDKRHWYGASFYKTAEDFNDEALAAKVAEVKPDWIILCIAGGKQEKVGLFLRNNSAECRVIRMERSDMDRSASDVPGGFRREAGSNQWEEKNRTPTCQECFPPGGGIKLVEAWRRLRKLCGT